MATSVDSTNYARYSYGPSSDGNQLCGSGEKLSAFGAAPVAVQTKPSALTGASDSTAVATAVNLLSTALTNLGFIA